ncbi:MAG TPA: hypothetical protein VIV60_25240 [Polyangiaceae bacterium]
MNHVTTSRPAPSASPRIVSTVAVFVALAAIGTSLHDLWKAQVTATALAFNACFWIVFQFDVGRMLRRSVLLTASYLTVPTASSFEVGKAYFTGEARLPSASWGLMKGPFNLDREYRVFVQPASISCIMPSSGLLLTAYWKRANFVFLVKLAGLPKNAYRGPYPDRHAAQAWLETHGQNLDPSQWQRRKLTIDGKEIRIGYVDLGAEERYAPTQVRAAILEATCLLIELRGDRRTTIVLIDLGGFGWFATYESFP